MTANRLDFFAVAADICGQSDVSVLPVPRHDLYAVDPWPHSYPKAIADRTTQRDAFGNVLNPRHCGCVRCRGGAVHVAAHRADGEVSS